MYAFLGRWKKLLNVVKPQKLALARAPCNQGNIDNYFKELNMILVIITWKQHLKGYATWINSAFQPNTHL